MKITTKRLDAKVEHLNYLTDNLNVPGKFAVQNGGTYYRLVFNRRRGGDPLPVSPSVKTLQEVYNIIDTLTTIMLVDEQNGWD